MGEGRGEEIYEGRGRCADRQYPGLQTGSVMTMGCLMDDCL